MERLEQVAVETMCKHHLILGQRLYKDLEHQDLWNYAGEVIRFKTNKVKVLKDFTYY